MLKTYVLDTNVLIHNPDSMFSFHEHEVVIPLIVVEELDKLKSREGMVGHSARTAARNLYRVFQEAGGYQEKVQLSSGGILRIETNHLSTEHLPAALNTEKNDNVILAVAYNLQHQHPERTIIFVTKDLYCAIKGEVIGLTVEDYESDKIKTDSVYSGWSELSVYSQELQTLFEGDRLIAAECAPDETFYPNQLVHMRACDKPNQSVLARYDHGELTPLRFERQLAWGIKPKNREQRMAYELIMDDTIPFVTIIGPAGTGKTILSMAAALQKVIEEEVYSRIILIRPVVAAGDDIGFLPGEEHEKLKPWMGSYFDAFERLTNLKPFHKEKMNTREKPNNSSERILEELRDRGLIEMKTFTYMRGRSLANAMVIIDEAQEMTPHLAKLMLTRAGENTKIVMIGDPSDNQIDNVLVDSKSNGLVYVVERLKESHLAGHITLSKVERSALSEMANHYL